MTKQNRLEELPADVSVVSDNLDIILKGYPRARLVSLEMWRDFVEQILLEKGNPEHVELHLRKSPQEIVGEVMRRGSINLGSNCRVVKCPSRRQPGVCALIPIDTGQGERLVCSGPIVQKQRYSLTLKKKPDYDKDWFSAHCPYSLLRLKDYTPGDDDAMKNFIELVYPVLKRHEGYREVDYWEKYGDVMREAGYK